MGHRGRRQPGARGRRVGGGGAQQRGGVVLPDELGEDVGHARDLRGQQRADPLEDDGAERVAVVVRGEHEVALGVARGQRPEALHHLGVELLGLLLDAVGRGVDARETRRRPRRRAAR